MNYRGMSYEELIVYTEELKTNTKELRDQLAVIREAMSEIDITKSKWVQTKVK